jgi:hypothetical protein
MSAGPPRDPRALGAKLAVVGSGISGLVAAYYLQRRHEVTVFEAEPRIGGHTHTVDVATPHGPLAIDTGFIVYNERTYPRFTALLRELRVSSQPTTMSFSVHCARTGFEYNGTSLGGLFAQRRNLLRPRHWNMLRGILRFQRVASARLQAGEVMGTLGEFLHAERFAGDVVTRYVVPMGAAIWSAPPAQILEFPAATFLGFLWNHGMLAVHGRPIWRVVCGGSRSYLRPLTASFATRILTGVPVRAVVRRDDGVRVHTAGGQELAFDGVVLATHSDQALALLGDASPAERDILGAIPYQANAAVLHTDTALLPRRRRAWAAWNYRIPQAPRAAVTMTYCMNILQGLDAGETYCVTLNDGAAIAPDRVVSRIPFAHPVFTARGIAAQARKAEISGCRRTWYCGAYWHYGFHEDGVRSAFDVLRDFGLPEQEAA